MYHPKKKFENVLKKCFEKKKEILKYWQSELLKVYHDDETTNTNVDVYIICLCTALHFGEAFSTKSTTNAFQTS